MFRPFRRITPAPRKPMPETTWPAMRKLSSAVRAVSAASMTNIAAPADTSALVRKPAMRCRHCRSRPMATPRINQPVGRPILSPVRRRATPASTEPPPRIRDDNPQHRHSSQPTTLPWYDPMNESHTPWTSFRDRSVTPAPDERSRSRWPDPPGRGC